MNYFLNCLEFFSFLYSGEMFFDICINTCRCISTLTRKIAKSCCNTHNINFIGNFDLNIFQFNMEFMIFGSFLRVKFFQVLCSDGVYL